MLMSSIWKPWCFIKVITIQVLFPKDNIFPETHPEHQCNYTLLESLSFGSDLWLRPKNTPKFYRIFAKHDKSRPSSGGPLLGWPNWKLYHDSKVYRTRGRRVLAISFSWVQLGQNKRFTVGSITLINGSFSGGWVDLLFSRRRRSLPWFLLLNFSF